MTWIPQIYYRIVGRFQNISLEIEKSMAIIKYSIYSLQIWCQVHSIRNLIGCCGIDSASVQFRAIRRYIVDLNESFWLSGYFWIEFHRMHFKSLKQRFGRFFAPERCFEWTMMIIESPDTAQLQSKLDSWMWFHERTDNV